MAYKVTIKRNPKLKGILLSAMEEATKQVAMDVMKAASRIVPVRTGRLKRSVFVAGGGFKWIVGYRAPYAAIVHRANNWLERATRSTRKRAPRIVAKAFKGRGIK